MGLFASRDIMEVFVKQEKPEWTHEQQQLWVLNFKEWRDIRNRGK